MKTRSAIRRMCQGCRIVKRRGRRFVICDRNKKHKQRQGFSTTSTAAAPFRVSNNSGSSYFAASRAPTSAANLARLGVCCVCCASYLCVVYVVLLIVSCCVCCVCVCVCVCVYV